MTDAPRRARLVPLLTIALFAAAAAGAIARDLRAQAEEDARNAFMRTTCEQIARTLDRWSWDHGGAYPPGPALEAALTGPGSLLPGRRIPMNPWADPPRPIRFVHEGLPAALPTVAQLRAGAYADGRPIDFAGLDAIPLGPGRLPDAGPPDARTYGAVTYTHDAYNLCVHAIGRAGDQARVVKHFSNMGGW